jgi:hypothetical protein
MIGRTAEQDRQLQCREAGQQNIELARILDGE